MSSGPDLKRTTVYGNVFFHLLPYIEQDNLLKKGVLTHEWFGTIYVPWKDDVAKARIRMYINESDPSIDPEAPAGFGCYAYNAQVFAVFDREGTLQSWKGAAKIPASFPDGTSNTIVTAQKYALCGDAGTRWAAWQADRWLPVFAVWSVGPESIFQVRPTPYLGPACDPVRASTPHENGIVVGLGDGSVRTLAPSMSPKTWWAACTPAANDSLGDDWRE